MKNPDEDQLLIQGILAGGTQQELAIKKLYETYFHLTYTGKKKYHQLSDDDLLTAYNASIISLRKQILTGGFRGDSSLWTYLNKIFYNKCIDIIRKYASNRVDAYEEVPDQVDQDNNIIRSMAVQEDFEALVSNLEELGSPCKQIIMDSEYWGFNADEIATRIGFSNARSVNSKKYSCLQRLRKMIDGVISTRQS